MEPRRINPDPDWSAILSVQAEVCKQREAEESRLRKMTAQMLQDEYNRQILEKQQAKAKEVERVRLEQQVAQRKDEALRQYEVRIRMEQKALNEHFRKEYDSHKEIATRRKGIEREEQIRTEKERIRTLHEDVSREADFHRQWKHAQIQDEQLALERARDQHFRERQQAEREKTEEQSRIRFNLQRDFERDQRLTDLRRSISQKMEARERVYRHVTRAEAEKQGRLQQWLAGNEARAREQSLEKETVVRDWKFYAKREVLSTLEKQRREIDQKRLMEMANFEEEKQSMAQKVETNRKIEAQFRMVRKMETGEYRAQLEQQLEEKRADEEGEKRMSLREREIHAAVLKQLDEGKVMDFVGVPGLQPRESPLKVTLKRTLGRTQGMAQSPVVRYAQTPTPTGAFSRVLDSPEFDRSPHTLHNQMLTPSPHSTSFELSYNPSRHNPIVNPLGDIIPRPSHPLSLAKGRGLHTLFSAGKEILNPAA